jgi:SAM-dependent methyltransferase
MRPIDCEPLYRDGRHYDLENSPFVEDIPFYLRHIRRYGDPVLELACGTGRITIPIAEAGYRVTGLDISTGMLSVARAKAAAKGLAIEWVQADCRTFDLGRTYAFVFFPFNSIAHLHDLESLEACFHRVREHLTSQGRFVIDIFNPKFDYFTRDPAERRTVAEYEDPDGLGTVTITEDNLYDRASQINHIKWYFSVGDRQDVEVQELNMRILFPQELDALLHYNGFTVEAKYGEYDDTPFSSASSKQLVVCRKRNQTKTRTL